MGKESSFGLIKYTLSTVSTAKTRNKAMASRNIAMGTCKKATSTKASAKAKGC